ncbi:alpha/beta fold hydrolase [Streptomyces tubercidicus]|uniref:alpha/beta fold hydrolase n=1 Tax=Streptomyces tubercidicus TaxID=47759 RepID=UPI002E10E794|nr:alpha/beta hydrolase [Streptomyces tubercidicus]
MPRPPCPRCQDLAPAVHHRTVIVNGLEVFYREAGASPSPTLVLLHGFPASSHMFRHLIPALADRYHVIAPDHIGFGRSAMPSPEDFPYTFEALTEDTAGLLQHLGIDRYALYVQDYGAPIGWRLALQYPDRITAIITQNGNAYEEGFVKPFWDGVFAYATAPGPRLPGPAAGGPGRRRRDLRPRRRHGIQPGSAQRRDPSAGVGHFALESHLDTIAEHIRTFLTGALA